MRTRTTASALALALVIGAALPGAALASPSKITTCDKLAASQELDGEIDKRDGSSGQLSGDWGHVSWTSNDITELEVADGVTLWLCVKTGGNQGENVFDHRIVDGAIPANLQNLAHAISHVAVFVIDVADPDEPDPDFPDPDDPDDPVDPT